MSKSPSMSDSGPDQSGQEEAQQIEQQAGAFYRRCHVCGHLGHAHEPVLECAQCGKVMAPFFYFDVRESPVYTDKLEPGEELVEKLASEKEADSFRHQPIWGLTVYW